MARTGAYSLPVANKDLTWWFFPIGLAMVIMAIAVFVGTMFMATLSFID